MAGEYGSIPLTPEKLRFWQDRNLEWHVIDDTQDNKDLPEWARREKKCKS